MRNNNEILEEIIDTIKGVDTSIFVNVENIVPVPTIHNYVNIDCSVGQIVDALDRIADKIEKPQPKPQPCPCDGQNQNIYAKYFDELFYQTRGQWLGVPLYF